jgi:hypothetical protein
LRASYRGYDEADEVTAAYSLAFSPDGSRVLAGYSKCIRVFDVGRPGRDCSRIVTHKKKQEGSIPGEQTLHLTTVNKMGLLLMLWLQLLVCR